MKTVVNQWTKEQDEILRELWPTHSATQLMPKLNKSRNAIIARANRLRMKKGHAYKNAPVSPLTPRTPRRRPIRITPPKTRRLRHRIAPTPPSTAVMDEPFMGVHLLDIGSEQCRFMKEPETLMFCGHPTVEGTSWCAHHKPHLLTGIPQMNKKDSRYYASRR